jgi:hypothetical protein
MTDIPSMANMASTANQSNKPLPVPLRYWRAVTPLLVAIALALIPAPRGWRPMAGSISAFSLALSRA